MSSDNYIGTMGIAMVDCHTSHAEVSGSISAVADCGPALDQHWVNVVFA